MPHILLTKDITDEDLQDLALNVIGIVDYDIEKECRSNIEFDGEDTMTNEMMNYLFGLIPE